MKSIIILMLGALWLSFTATMHAQTNGEFGLEKSVIASGGGTSTAGDFSISGTIGQSEAGKTQSSALFSVAGGFWTSAPLAPTATHVAISGTVRTADGAGIRSVVVTLTDSRGAVRTTVTGSFGIYRFENIEAGENYVLSVTAKRYVFANPTRIVSVTDEINELDFTADPR